MASTLQQEQQSIDAAIARAVLVSIPEDWTSALLKLERSKPMADLGEFAHTLSSSDGRRPMIPDDSLLDATFQLDDLFRRYGAYLTKVIYRVEQLQDGQWNYVADYQHEKMQA
jgi:hypothetical protein